MKTGSLISILLTASISLPLGAGGACNSPPATSADVVQVGFGSFHLFDPLSNDQDVDGDALILVSVTNPTIACAGNIVEIEGNLVRYTPAGAALPGGATTCTVNYQAGDGYTQSPGTVTLVFPPAAIFSDGFESANTNAWDEVVPGS